MDEKFWNERYAETEFIYGTAPNDFLAQVLPRLPRGDALMLAEGEGRNAVFLAQHGMRVTAVDQSSVGLAKAGSLAREKGVGLQTIVANLEHFTITPSAYDIIGLIWCHLPPALRARVHQACVAGLRTGGALVLEAYRPEQLQHGTGGPQDVSMLMTLQDLRREFAGLDLEIAEEITRDVHEGRFHGGLSAVVRVLGFKR